MTAAEPRSWPLRGEGDWSRVRALLVATHASAPPYWNWDIRHWDGDRFHRDGPIAWERLERSVRLWESAAGDLVGAAHVEPDGDAFFQLDPDARDVEPALVAWTETYLADEGTEPGHVETPVMDYDVGRQRLLAERGWSALDYGGRVRRRRLEGGSLDRPALAPGYAIRTTSAATIDGDAQRLADLLNAAFRRTIHTAAEYLAFSGGSPSFRHDLNLVAVSPDGTFAAHVGLTFDAENRLGIVEPVCTHPDHRRRGLATALLFEGLRRLRDLGAELVHVESGDAAAANAFYDSCGFTERYDLRWWRYRA